MTVAKLFAVSYTKCHTPALQVQHWIRLGVGTFKKVFDQSTSTSIRHLKGLSARLSYSVCNPFHSINETSHEFSNFQKQTYSSPPNILGRYMDIWTLNLEPSCFIYIIAVVTPLCVPQTLTCLQRQSKDQESLWVDTGGRGYDHRILTCFSGMTLRTGSDKQTQSGEYNVVSLRRTQTLTKSRNTGVFDEERIWGCYLKFKKFFCFLFCFSSSLIMMNRC